MDIDYIKNKVDFINYNDFKYHDFFVDEVQPSCKIFSSSDNSASALGGKVKNIKDKISNIITTLPSYWDDDVEKSFIEYVTSCETYIGTVEDSINSNLSSAEETYKQLSTLILSLELQNANYQSRWDEKPLQTDSKYTVTVPAEKDERGIWHDSYTYQNGTEYLKDYRQWESDVTTLAGDCLSTIAEIQPLITKLTMEINGNTIEGLDASSGTDITAPIFEIDSSLIQNSLGLTGTVEEYIAANGLKYYKITQFGQEFYVLAPIKSARTQESQQCLSYARANAIAITERNGYDIPLQGGFKNGCVYTSTDPNEIYKIMLNEYLNGRSVALEVNGSTKDNSRHFVALAGFEADTDFNNIQPENVLIIDSTVNSTANPAGYKQLGTENGGQMRYLKSAREMTYNSFDTDYTVIVYSDVDYSEMFPNTEKAPKDPYGASQSHAGDGAITFANV